MKRVLSLAVAASLVLGLSACSGGSGVISGSNIAIGLTTAVTSLNADIAAGAATEAANNELANLTNASFYSFDQNEELKPNLDFGSVAVTKANPFTVKYLLTGKAVWSDGEPVSASDLMLSWAAATNFGKANFKSARLGNGLAQTSGLPTVGDSNLSLTIAFTRPIADYKTALTVNVAAHAVAKLAFASENLDSKAANQRVLSAVQSANRADLKQLAKAYFGGFKVDGGLNSTQTISSGAYLVVSATPSTVTLKANPKNAAMQSARAETINFKLYSSSLAMISDLRSGKLDLAALSPNASEPNTAIVSALKSASASGVANNLVGTSFVEALVFNQQDGSSFASTTYGAAGDKNAQVEALSLRQAFMNIVPTSKIETLVGATETVQESKSFAFTADSSFYQSTIQDSGVMAYQFADNQKAYNEIHKLGSRVPVRVLFDTNNPRAQIEYSTLAEKASEVGFGLSNVSTGDTDSVLASGAYDVYLAPHSVLGVGGVELEQSLASLPNQTDTSLIDSLSQYATASDALTQAAVLKKIDSQLIASAYGLPMYQLPMFVAASKKFSKTPSLFGGASLTAGYATWNLAG